MSIGNKRTAHASSVRILRILMRCMTGCFTEESNGVSSQPTIRAPPLAVRINFWNSIKTHSFFTGMELSPKSNVADLQVEINSQSCVRALGRHKACFRCHCIFFLCGKYIKPPWHTLRFGDQLFDQSSIWVNYTSFRHVSTPERTQIIARFLSHQIMGPLYFLLFGIPKKKKDLGTHLLVKSMRR